MSGTQQVESGVRSLRLNEFACFLTRSKADVRIVMAQDRNASPEPVCVGDTSD